MITKTLLSGFVFFVTFSPALYGQTWNVPAVGLKSHQTMEVRKVETTPQKTIVYLSIENRISGGTFCADRNIYLVYPDGRRIKMEKASGIPLCPDSHKFKKQGEILEFSISFPAAEPGTGWIDIIEDCSDNCFSVYGILLNEAFSRRIDEAIMQADKGHIDSAIGLYQKLISEAGQNEAGIAGSLYSDLITLMVSKGYTASAADWYKRLAASNLPGKDLYIQNLNFRGIRF
jgi:hypothetical protein